MSVVVVTGASRGIGAAIAESLGARGFDVCVNHRASAEAAAAVVERIVSAGGKARAVAGDVGDEADVRALFEAADALGPLAGLVNNAAYFGRAGRRVEDAVAEDLARVFQVNVVGAMLCAREAVRRLSTAHGGPGGRIVNISSTAAERGSPGDWVDYAASKAALNTFTKGLALEVAREGIRVNAVAPGLTETDSHARAGKPDRVRAMVANVPLGRAGEPQEIAAAVAWLIADAPDYLTGAVLPVGGGF